MGGNSTGLIVAAYYVGFIGGSHFTVKAVGRVGQIRVFALIGEGIVPRSSVMISYVGMELGGNPSGVCGDHEPSFELEGTIRRVEVENTRGPRLDDEIAGEIRTAPGTQ